jgi:hypothetical protein
LPVKAVLSGDRLEWRRIGNLLALVRHYDMTGAATLLRQTLSVVDIGRRRGLRTKSQGSRAKTAGQCPRKSPSARELLDRGIQGRFGFQSRTNVWASLI